MAYMDYMDLAVCYPRKAIKLIHSLTCLALDGAVFDIAQILAYLVHNMSRSQL